MPQQPVDRSAVHFARRTHSAEAHVELRRNMVWRFPEAHLHQQAAGQSVANA
jgi:hypothetical protein